MEEVRENGEVQDPEKAETVASDQSAGAGEGTEEGDVSARLTACQQEAMQYKDSWMRACADLENYRRRVRKEKEEAARFGNEGLIRELLPVLDNLESAVAHAEQNPGEQKGLLEGVKMTIDLFCKALEKFGAVPFSALGEPFDPARHEAMGQMESADQAPNTVVMEMRKGCFLHERLLRPAMVMVASAPREKSSSDIENGAAGD